MKAKARAVARSVAKHRVFFLFVMGLFTIGLLAGSYAIQSGATFSGQTRAGDHQWWDNIGNDAFCENCHTAIASDYAAGPHGNGNTTYSCSSCHSPGSGQHAASAAACTDCHGSEAGEITAPGEAHNGIMASLGETVGDASQTCQSCHTHAEVTMAITPDDPIPLQMGG